MDRGEIKGIKISRNKDIETHLFMDDQVIMADSEDALQISVHKLEMVACRFGLKISTRKMKTAAFKGRDPMRSKILVNNTNIEQTLSIT
jgi:hypothetical protein